MPRLSELLRFGKIFFRCSAENDDSIDLIEAIFPRGSNPQASGFPEEEFALARNSVEVAGKTDDDLDYLMIVGLISQLYAAHSDCLWMDAAALKSPEGKLCLLAGPSGSGKTTLTLALTLTRKWLALSEDITLIDPVRKLILPCPTPSKILSDTIQRITAVGNVLPGVPVPQGLYFEPSCYLHEPVTARFDEAVLLSLAPAGSPASSSLSASNINSRRMIRELLPISNLLRLSGATGAITGALHEADCKLICGGELSERIGILEGAKSVSFEEEFAGEF